MKSETTILQRSVTDEKNVRQLFLDAKHYLFPLLSFPLILIHLLKIFLNTQLLWLGEHIAGHAIAYLIHEGAYQRMP